MEIRQLQIFLKAASLQNITLAAQEMGYSQSNVSAQIQKLETELGKPLFDRIGKHIELNSYGREILPLAENIVSAAVQLTDRMRSELEFSGVVKIGMVDSLFQKYLEKLAEQIHTRFPKLQLEVEAESTHELKEMLKRGSIDIAFIIDDVLEQKDLTRCHAERVPMIIVCSRACRLFGKKEVLPEELSKEEFILMEEDFSGNIAFRQMMEESGARIHTFMTLKNADMAKQLLENGNYVSILPKYTVSDAIEAGSLYELKVPSFTSSQYIQTILNPGKAVTIPIKGVMEIFEGLLSES